MRLRFLEKKQESGDVWSFFFDVAEGTAWKAGQSIRLELPKRTWGYDERRFTISSGPSERHLRITTRISDSEFKQLLAALKPDTEIDGHNIEGDFVWQGSDRPKLFIAAGIGITPFRAILAERPDTGGLSMLYGTRADKPVFYDELRGWLGKNLQVVNNRLDLDIVKNLTPNWQESLVYISGPEQMVFDLKKQLVQAGMDYKNIKTDLFTLSEQY